MSIKIALAGNPNCGKTTLFNALTGSNQFVGNWPGVTVEKKEGRLKGNRDVTVTDLPGIYSLSPYTLEEVVARNYLINEKPDVILNIVDGTNIERNLYLSTQLMELGIPVVMAVNMGGDDFVAKPFDLDVLTAKVQALLRRTYDFGAAAPLLEARGAVLDTGDNSLTYEGQKLELTRNEYRMLQVLLEQKGRTVSRETLMQRLWETDSFVDENTLTVNMARLRRKLEGLGLTEFIRTKKGLGYLIE